jgi:hypothetical protein
MNSFNLISSFLTRRDEGAIFGLDSVIWVVLRVSISSLPEFRGKIHWCLAIKTAVGTWLLSRNWRYAWILPELMFRID